MSEPKPAIVYVTTGIQKLTQEARRTLVRNVECERKLTDGFIPEWMDQAQTALQPSNSFSMPVGWIGLVIISHKGDHLCRSYAVTGGGLNDERVQAIGLRTALLATYPVRDITVYMSTSTITSMFVDSVTRKVSDMWINEDWELVGPNVDTLKECGRIVKIRNSRGKKTTVSLDTVEGHSDKVKDMVRHTNRAEHGVVDSVIYMPPLNSSDGCPKRLEDAALNLGMTLDPVGKSTCLVTSSVNESDKNCVNKVIDYAVMNADGAARHDGDSSMSLICSSCSNLVRITYRESKCVPSVSALVTTHCTTCAAGTATVTKLKPAIIKRLAGYDFIRKQGDTHVVIITDTEHVQHVDVKEAFKAITKDHTVAMFDYDRGVMGELRGGFF